MAEFMMVKMEDDLGDFDAGGSTNSDNDKVDSILIKKILCEMKSEFNRGMCNINDDSFKDVLNDGLSSEGNLNSSSEFKPFENGHCNSFKDDCSVWSEQSPNVIQNDEKPSVNTDECTGDESVSPIIVEQKALPIVITLQVNEDEIEKMRNEPCTSNDNLEENTFIEIPVVEEPVEKKAKRSSSLRNLDGLEPDLGLKRSSRRTSKEFSRESVLQNAIARKEKSFSSLSLQEIKKRRSSRFREDRNQAKSKPNLRNASKPNHIEPGEELANNKGTLKKKSSSLMDIDSIGGEDEKVESKNISQKKCFKNIEQMNKKNSILSKENISEDEHSENQASSNHHSENEWEKETDNSSLGSVTPTKKTSAPATEERVPPVKSSLPTSPREGAEATYDESTMAALPWRDGLCDCQNVEGVFPSTKVDPRILRYCKALSSVDSRVIGCCGHIESNTPLLRPGKTWPLCLYCQHHINRLFRHQCCPTCGLFCTMGVFNECQEKHLFHTGCELKEESRLLCPHCGTEEFTEVKVFLGKNAMVLTPMQSTPKRFSLARITLTHVPFHEDSSPELEELKLLVPPKEILINKVKISAEGIPTVEKEKLENLMHAFSSKNDVQLRCTQRAFLQAAKAGDVDKVVQILGMGGSSLWQASNKALHAAASQGHLSVVHILVQAGCSLETMDKSQLTPLMAAAMNGHSSVVKYLVRAGADVAFKVRSAEEGTDGMTALHLAAKVGDLEACHYLLTAANTPLSFVDTVDDGRWTPLVWAAENRHSDVVRYLLEKKADPHVRDAEMNVALHWSAFSGSMEITEDLLNYGSNINFTNAHGDTPLHIAARQAAENCVMLLLARGARTDIRNKAGQNPLNCVVSDSSYCKAAIQLNMKIREVVGSNVPSPRILSNDISLGREPNPIQCVNAVDDTPLPQGFTYIRENCFTTTITIDRRITSLTGCNCEDMCTTSSCMCSRISLQCWYDNRGKLLPDFNFEDPPMIFECNQTCNCNELTCKNRVVQKGMKVRLEVCKTSKKSWGVITLREIPKGSYVCEYVGEIISDCEADIREDDSYLFDLDSRDGETYCIDARKYGNVTRFVNHSCNPNLVPVRVFVDHHDLHFPRIAFFAARDIRSGEELGFDYGEKFWMIKYKNFTCACDEENCRYSVEKIQETLEKYKEKLKKEDELV